jgi:hypothetical protein
VNPGWHTHLTDEDGRELTVAIDAQADDEADDVGDDRPALGLARVSELTPSSWPLLSDGSSLATAGVTAARSRMEPSVNRAVGCRCSSAAEVSRVRCGRLLAHSGSASSRSWFWRRAGKSSLGLACDDVQAHYHPRGGASWQTLPPREKVVLFYHSGNRDESAFESPWGV